MGVMFLENAMIVKTKGPWEKRSSVPGLRENIEEEDHRGSTRLRCGLFLTLHKQVGLLGSQN